MSTRTKRRRLSPSQVLRLRELAADGRSDSQLAVLFHIHPSTAKRIRSGRVYFNVGGPFTRNEDIPVRLAVTAKASKPVAVAVPEDTTGLDDMSVTDMVKFLKSLSQHWPKMRQAFLMMDDIINQK